MNKINVGFENILQPVIKSDSNRNETLKECYDKKLIKLNLTSHVVEQLLDIDRKTLQRILNNENDRVDTIQMIKIGHFLGLTIMDTMELYLKDMPTAQISEMQTARDASFILDNFDIAFLRKIKLIQTKASLEEIRDTLVRYFDLQSIYEYSDDTIAPAFSRSKKNSNDKIRYFWIKSALGHFDKIENPNDYNRSELLKLIPQIKAYSRDEANGLITVARALYHVGVTTIFQPSVPGLQVKGASFSCAQNKPCIVLSDLNKNYPTLWFVLLHELYHVLYDFEAITERKFHLTGEADLFLLDEEAADDFAQNILLNEDRLTFILPYIESENTVDKWAKEWRIHPSIIYAIYAYRYAAWGKVSKQIPKMDIALKLFHTYPFDKQKLQESVDMIKEKIYIN